MQSSVKQRVLGFVVLVSLAIIFLPSILDGDNGRQPLQKTIPVRPAAKPVEIVIKEPLSPDTAAKQEALQQETLERGKEVIKSLAQPDNSGLQQDKKSRVTATPQKTTKEKVNTTNAEQIGSVSWVVQVGTFSNKNNALTLVEKLQQNDLPAFKSTKIVAGKTNYVVYVGQFKEKADAQQKQQQIEAVAGLKVLIQPFKGLLD